ncbi:hypothetical protein BKA56DRAFT_239770 [Ilyonectria sp. MPI-CAGE-AT-0026]|nr:hypothetical protein BKA56DRAFT_239770 [Ilyonectria sp. MPI-CAGE-AT-0026]
MPVGCRSHHCKPWLHRMKYPWTTTTPDMGRSHRKWHRSEFILAGMKVTRTRLESSVRLSPHLAASAGGSGKRKGPRSNLRHTPRVGLEGLASRMGSIKASSPVLACYNHRRRALGGHTEHSCQRPRHLSNTQSCRPPSRSRPSAATPWQVSRGLHCRSCSRPEVDPENEKPSGPMSYFSEAASGTFKHRNTIQHSCYQPNPCVLPTSVNLCASSPLGSASS